MSQSGGSFVCGSCGAAFGSKYKCCLVCGSTLEARTEPGRSLTRRHGFPSNETNEVIQGQVLNKSYYPDTSVLGCPSCSSLYWIKGNQWRELCTQCGNGFVVDVDGLLAERESVLKRDLPATMDSLRREGLPIRDRFVAWLHAHQSPLGRALLCSLVLIGLGGYLLASVPRGEPAHQIGVAFLVVGIIASLVDIALLVYSTMEPRKAQTKRQQTRIQRTIDSTLFHQVAFGPLSWYLTEQYNAEIRYGRRLTHAEARERIDALLGQHRHAAELQRQQQIAAVASLVFLSISSQLGRIEQNQRRGAH